MNSGIILMAGNGVRSGLEYNKTLYPYLGKPLFQYSLDAFQKNSSIDEIFLVINPNDEDKIKNITNLYKEVKIVYGGAFRNESLKKALALVKNENVIVHDAARPFVTSDDITMIIKALDEYDVVSLYHDVTDTIKDTEDQVITLNRKYLKAVTTPQGFTKKTFSTILENTSDVLDELQIFEGNSQFSIGFVKELHENKKFTNSTDFLKPNYLVGHSLDFHPLVKNRQLILGGIAFDYPLGLMGHSDADVVYHAVAEAIIGALGLGDLGTLFPDNDNQYLNIDSSYFLIYMSNILNEKKYKIKNLDVIIYLEKPNLRNYKHQMEENLARCLKTSFETVNVKATTMEKKGVIGNGEGIASEAVVLLEKYEVD